MAQKFIFLVIYLFSIYLSGQIRFKTEHVNEIVYMVSYNGNTDENQNPIWVFADKNNALITTRDHFSEKGNYPFEMTFVNHNDKTFNQIAYLNSQESVSMFDENSLQKQEFEFLNETKKILGYNCKKAKTIINSNTIELWYTDELNYKAAPTILGQQLGVVLEMVRNNNYVITATEVKKTKILLPNFILKSNPEILEKMDYQDKIWKSRFTTIPIFDKQQIHFSEEFTPKENVLRFANGTVAVKKVKIPEIGNSDKVFIDLVEKSNGDAYDRTGSVFLIPTDKKQSFLDGLQNGAKTLPVYKNGNGKEYQGVVSTQNFSPLVELMRFFTPFGVPHFNDRLTLKGKVWQDSVIYRQDISDYAEMINGKEVYIGTFIGNYDKGGHEISMNLTVHKEESSKPNPSKIISLFNTTNVMEMAGQEYATMFDVEEGLFVEFELKEKLNNAQLKYITTGHGGWENGDEFVPKKNTILLNEKIIFDLIPWREDCGSYRLYNPVSGNFSNGLSSSDYSRSNWCPATVTNPYIVELGNLEAGKHKIQVKIPQGKPEGGSFSAWNVSGVLIGN